MHLSAPALDSAAAREIPSEVYHAHYNPTPSHALAPTGLTARAPESGYDGVGRTVPGVAHAGWPLDAPSLRPARHGPVLPWTYVSASAAAAAMSDAPSSSLPCAHSAADSAACGGTAAPVSALTGALAAGTLGPVSTAPLSETGRMLLAANAAATHNNHHNHHNHLGHGHGYIDPHSVSRLSFGGATSSSSSGDNCASHSCADSNSCFGASSSTGPRNCSSSNNNNNNTPGAMPAASSVSVSSLGYHGPPRVSAASAAVTSSAAVSSATGLFPALPSPDTAVGSGYGGGYTGSGSYGEGLAVPLTVGAPDRGVPCGPHARCQPAGCAPDGAARCGLHCRCHLHADGSLCGGDDCERAPAPPACMHCGGARRWRGDARMCDCAGPPPGSHSEETGTRAVNWDPRYGDPELATAHPRYSLTVGPRWTETVTHRPAAPAIPDRAAQANTVIATKGSAAAEFAAGAAPATGAGSVRASRDTKGPYSAASRAWGYVDQGFAASEAEGAAQVSGAGVRAQGLAPGCCEGLIIAPAPATTYVNLQNKILILLNVELGYFVFPLLNLESAHRDIRNPSLIRFLFLTSQATRRRAPRVIPREPAVRLRRLPPCAFAAPHLARVPPRAPEPGGPALCRRQPSPPVGRGRRRGGSSVR